jgi:hypothetical protein
MTVETCSVCGWRFPRLDNSLPLDEFRTNTVIRLRHTAQHQDEVQEQMRTGVLRMSAREARIHGGSFARGAEGVADYVILVFHVEGYPEKEPLR